MRSTRGIGEYLQLLRDLRWHQVALFGGFLTLAMFLAWPSSLLLLLGTALAIVGMLVSRWLTGGLFGALGGLALALWFLGANEWAHAAALTGAVAAVTLTIAWLLDHVHESRERLLRATPEATVWLDRAGIIRQVSPSAQALIGSTDAAPGGRLLDELLVAVPGAPLATLLAESVHDPGGAVAVAARIERELVRADGSHLPVELMVSRLADDGDEDDALYSVTLRDIRHQRAIEDTLRRDASMYRVLVQDFPRGAVLQFDRNLRITLATGRILRLIDLDGAALVGRPLNDVFPDALSAVIDAYFRATLGGEEAVFEHTLGPLIMETTTRPLYDDVGRITGGIAVMIDVSRRSQIEGQVRNSEELLRTVISTLPVVIFVIGPDGRYRLSEGRGLALLGRGPGEVVGQSVFDMYSENAPLLAMVRRALAGDENQAVVEIHGHWFDASCAPLRDADGRPDGLIGVAVDVTDRVEALHRLRESEDRFRMLASATIEGILIHADGVIIDANESVAQMFDYTIAELRDRHVLELIARPHRGEALRYLNDPDDDLIEVEGVRRDGTTFPVELSGKEIWVGGGRACVTAIRDVSDRRRDARELEERRNFALQITTTMGQGVVVSDIDGEISFVNPAFVSLLGYEGPDALLGMRTDDLIAEDLPRFRADRERCWQGQTTSADLLLRRNDGSTVLVHGTSVAQVVDGEVVGSISVATDLSQRIKLEHELAEARDAALEASRMKSEFLATMSHEIRTPLNGVIGMAELLLDAPLAPEEREYVQIVHNEGRALLEIINEILDFSKIEAGRLVLDEIELSVASIVEGAVDLFAPKAREKGITLTSYVAPEIPDELIGDPLRFKQVLLNLVSNAVKFTETGEVLVTAAAERATDDVVSVRLAVRDSGIGLAREQLAHIFDPFTQADGSTSRRFGGTGLGLAISQRLVDLMAGEIGVESVAGNGSLFWYTVPLRRVHATAGDHNTIVADLAGLRVLVVDDNRTLRVVSERYLTAWGVRVSAVADVDDAIERITRAIGARDPFALVLTSLTIDYDDAFAFLERVKQGCAADAPGMVLVSEIDERGLASHSMAAGFAGYLTRPLKRDQLLATIRQALARPSRRGTAPLAGAPDQTARIELPGPASPATRVLVVDDDEANRTIVVAQLSRFGYEVDAIGDGEEAVGLVASNPERYGLVLMDCHMPGVDGYAATRAIRYAEDVDVRVPIIALTADALPGNREQCLAAGMDGIVTKPASAEMLRTVIEHWIPAAVVR